MHAHINAQKPDGWRVGWEDIKIALRQRCVERTKKLKYVEGKEVTWRKNAMKRIDERAAQGTATPDEIAKREELRTEVRAMSANALQRRS